MRWYCACVRFVVWATDECIIIISYRDEFRIQPKYQTNHWPASISLRVPPALRLQTFGLVCSTKARQQNFRFYSMFISVRSSHTLEKSQYTSAGTMLALFFKKWKKWKNRKKQKNKKNQNDEEKKTLICSMKGRGEQKKTTATENR